jgi:hypothetical protein
MPVNFGKVPNLFLIFNALRPKTLGKTDTKLIARYIVLVDDMLFTSLHLVRLTISSRLRQDNGALPPPKKIALQFRTNPRSCPEGKWGVQSPPRDLAPMVYARLMLFTARSRTTSIILLVILFSISDNVCEMLALSQESS